MITASTSCSGSSHADARRSTAAMASQTTLRIFTGGQQRPDVMRKIADDYEKRAPGVKIEVEVGGATSEQQQQYLNTVLARRIRRSTCPDRRDPPGQWAAAGWAEPLDSYLGAGRTPSWRATCPPIVKRTSSTAKLIALPYFADASSSTTARPAAEARRAAAPDLGRN